MKPFRFLSGAALLLGACDLLWAPFQGLNPGYCDPSAPFCTPAIEDGGTDGDVADAAGIDEAVSDVSDAAMPVDAGVDGSQPDAAQPPDLQCNPGTVYPWVADPTPPGASGVALTGVTGNGLGDVWTVGNPTYAAHRAAGWSEIGGVGSMTLGRVAYAPKQLQALVIGKGLLAAGVLHLNPSSAGATDSFLLGTLSGIWVSAAPESLPYIVGPNGTFKSYSGGNWNSVGPSAANNLSGIAGSGMAATTAIWGVTGTTNELGAYPGSGSWLTASTGASVFYSVWVSPNNGVVLVGKNGSIKIVPAALPPIGAAVAMTSPTTATLTDVAGTQDGKHLFAVGAGGTIIHWESSCRVWTKETSPTTQDLSALWVSDVEHTVWAVGDNGTVLHRTVF